MFEAKPPRAADSFRIHESWDGEALRELTWADLVARLSASRALRNVFGRTEEAEASFDAPSAQRIAAHHNGELVINHEDSGYGKEQQRIARASVNGIGTHFVSGVARK